MTFNSPFLNLKGPIFKTLKLLKVYFQVVITVVIQEAIAIPNQLSCPSLFKIKSWFQIISYNINVSVGDTKSVL